MSSLLTQSLRDPLVLDVLTQADLRPKTLKNKQTLETFIDDFLWPIIATFELGPKAISLTVSSTLENDRETEINFRRVRSKSKNFFF